MLVKNVSREEMRLQCLFISEQVIAQVKKVLYKIARVEIFRRDTIMDELPQILSETAAEVKKSVLGLRFFEKRENTSVAWLEGYGEVEEFQYADAWILFDGPCTFSLCAR